QKDVYPTFLTVPGFEVKGGIHFTTLQKPEIFLTDTTTTFVPVTHATIVSASAPHCSWSVPVVFVPRASIMIFYLDAPT
ncbi:MAG: hypothetical protein KJZ93_21435, partial [Caldilineaceae bacterium]|nr:hypothetical protein [Caldilineaceae bacterium]